MYWWPLVAVPNSWRCGEVMVSMRVFQYSVFDLHVGPLLRSFVIVRCYGWSTQRR